VALTLHTAVGPGDVTWLLATMVTTGPGVPAGVGLICQTA
jgi:hypothetical protein